MVKLQRTNPENPDFIALVKLLDSELAVRDGKDHAFYSPFNKIDKIKHVVIAYEDAVAIGCGAIKEFSSEAMEVKRMFTVPAVRGRKVATTILKELEIWAKEMSYRKCVLETGKRQPEAIAVYGKSGYQIIPNYGQYIGIENSVCFEKII